MATRATKKEYSSELGPRNDSKMEPKMEPKGQRPTFTLHIRPLLGSSIFTAFLETEKSHQTSRKKLPFRKFGAKLGPKVPLLGSRPYEKWVSFFGLFCSGDPWEPHFSTESLKVTLGAPKCLPKWSKIIEELPRNRQKKKQKRNARVWIPGVR